MATLAAIEISAACPADRVSISCYTFGAPRTGNRAFAREYDAAVPDTWSVINDQVCRFDKRAPWACAWAVMSVLSCSHTTVIRCVQTLRTHARSEFGTEEQTLGCGVSHSHVTLTRYITAILQPRLAAPADLVSHCECSKVGRPTCWVDARPHLVSEKVNPRLCGPGRCGSPRQIHQTVQASRAASHHKCSWGRHRPTLFHGGEGIAEDTRKSLQCAHIWQCHTRRGGSQESVSDTDRGTMATILPNERQGRDRFDARASAKCVRFAYSATESGISRDCGWHEIICSAV